ncbi:SH3KBP1-binding protein 1 [Seminavis robusta]|uniref:SH3KBP1-binding protein 1 n=1 Tax=Seminavis robusta TaxID=568900 RepID=A0A9N8HAT8_9STRA|nr:SH3KBP1-binding protein 1 [Seminavis robusta]|eukprot:Sro333_g119530.1 SH3KBP1-binding protein 1 (337) ;mRNA; f:35549-36559
MEINLDDALKQLPGLFKEREERLDKREKDLQRLKATLEEEYPNAGEPDDVLELDVGGTHLSVSRRTLTQVDLTMLAAMFSGRWDDSLPKTKDGRIFIDQPIEIFRPLIDYLRALATETPIVRRPYPPSFNDPERRFDFYRMVEYYGMSLGVYQVGVYQLASNGVPSTLVASHPDFEVRAGGDFSTYCLQPLENRHRMYIKSFEVKVPAKKSDSRSPTQVGWMREGHGSYLFNRKSDGTEGVGYGNYSVAWDFVRSGIVVQGQFTEVPNASVKAGSVIRCEDRGNSWYIDGSLVASTQSQKNVALISISSVGVNNMIPCVSLKGKCEFKTTIEFHYV